MCLLLTAHTNIHSVTCSLAVLFSHFKLPGTQTAFESLFLSLFALLSLLCVFVVYFNGCHVFLIFWCTLLRTPLCKEFFSGFPWSLLRNYCSFIAVQSLLLFCSSPNHHTSANYKYLKRSSMCLIFLLPSICRFFFRFTVPHFSSRCGRNFTHLSCLCPVHILPSRIDKKATP